MKEDLEMMRRVLWVLGGITEFLFSEFRWYRQLRRGTWKIAGGPAPYHFWIRVDDSHIPKAEARKKPKHAQT